MESTIADRVRESAERGFVGRRRELEELGAATAAQEAPFLVAFVHGPGGIGKSTLVRRVLSGLPPLVRGLYLDGRDVEPTPEGFCRAIGRALGLPEMEMNVATIASALGGTRVTLVVDTYEALGLLDAWLRTRFLPALPATTVTILAGRDRPASAWYASAGWPGLVAEFPLGCLSAEEAADLLRSRGLDVAQAAWANGFARGHPLALELAAAAVRADPSCTQGEPVAPAGLLESFLGQLPATTVEAVEAAAMVRRVTEPILAALLDDPGNGFSALRALPFVEEAGDGLLLHDVVRDTVNHNLSTRDPDARREYRRRAVSYLTDPGRIGPSDPWQHTADLIYLIENPVLRDACFPSSRPSHWVEPASTRDRAAIFEIAARHESPVAAAMLAQWWDRHPGSFSVAKDSAGSVAAFVQIMELGDLDPGLRASDPVAAAWHAHLKQRPPGPDDGVLVMRRWLGWDSGELRSPAVSACWLDVKRVYMQMRPRLRRIYSVVVDLPHVAPIFVPLGFAPAGDAIILDGVAAQPVWLDFGPGSVDGWLARLVGSETTAPPPAGMVTGLSSRELEVLRLVSAGRTNREIGELLFISEKTASRHLSNVFDKLGIHTRAEAARIAAEHGLTTAER
ncbi:MAG TPA: LuxR C-terminal-related transcriptional regulator [Streptosporangiaceae bacterium]|nr:LuxR C-terminal-related transcriptional regulator [Streptosporangiaceae bacterium]